MIDPKLANETSHAKLVTQNLISHAKLVAQNFTKLKSFNIADSRSWQE